MRRGWVAAVVASAGLMGLGVVPAGAQVPGADAAEVAAEVGTAGWYADDGATGTDDPARLDGVSARLRSAGDGIGFALLAAEPEGSSPAFAEAVLDRVPGTGTYGVETMIVLSPDDVGVVSDEWDDAAIDRALDATLDDLRADPVTGLEALGDALVVEPTMAEQDAEAADGDDGLPAPVAVAALVALVGFAGYGIVRRAAGYDGYDPGADDDWSARRRRRRRYGSSFRSSGNGRRSGGGSSRRSSGGSRRGRGGRRL